MKELDKYFILQKELYDYFGYTEDWRVIPLEDSTDYYWRLYGEGPGEVRFAVTKEKLDDPEQDYYVDEIYTQRHLPKWVYHGKDYTMVVVDTHADGNKLLRIFDNSKEG